MSTGTVHYTHTTAGWDITAHILPKGLPNKSRTAAQCSGWTTQDSSCWPNRSTNANSSNALCSEWTGAESRIVLQNSSIRRLYDAKKFVVICASPVGGIIHLRPGARSSSFSRSLVHRLYSAPGLCSIRPSSISDTRLAYGYFLGPTYGYGGGFGSSSILVFIVLGFIALQAFQSLASDGSLTRSREKVSVLKLQVGLLGFARTLQNDLERIADRADTSTSRGLHYVLTETVLALLRQPDMCILGTSLSEVKRGMEAGERRFNQLSLEERGKFDEETLVNVDGNRKRVQEKIRGDGFSNEYIVVTLLVAADGDYSLPAIYDNDDLKEALKKLGSIPADNIQGVEILWTPQDKSDSLTERDLLRNYPLLKSL